MATVTASEDSSRRVFISYSTSDRHRVDGLERLLALLGTTVFVDYKRLQIGSRWRDEINRALEQTDVTLVYWTRSASKSLWVRSEYDYFIAHHPDRPLVPIVGDETPLSEPLKERQAMTFVPLINELLELKRSMEAEGRKRSDIQAALRNRLEQAGLRLDKSDENRIFRFFGIAGWMAWLPAPLFLLKWIWRILFETTAHLSPAQVVMMLTVAAVAAALTRQADNVRFVNRAQAYEAELEATRAAAGQRVNQAAANVAQLTRQLADSQDASAKRVAESKANEEKLTKQLRGMQSMFASHALIKAPGREKPVLMRFIDSTTGRHRFTVQIPSRQDFDFWIPAGSYEIDLADMDISDRMDQLVSGDVNCLLQKMQLNKGWIYELGPGRDQGDKSIEQGTIDRWKRKGPTARR